ncbi:hypothetical protein [Catellatospora sp. NPDC049609]|uniref:hypothetical protein n=1 Tax=Catellatospora sp. NPDC049609 TaxID=3155505 RepID=UPI00341CF108
MELDHEGGGPERLVRQRERISRELREGGVPVFVLAGPLLPGRERFAGLEEADGRIVGVRIVHEGDRAHGPWAGVHCARTDGTPGTDPLRWELTHGMAAYGETVAAADWAEGGMTVVVDGVAVPGRLLRAGGRWWAASCHRDGVEIAVVARDWHPDALGVRTVDDLGPMLTRHWYGPPAQESAAGHREPHLTLVEASLRLGRERRRWWGTWGPPPQRPVYWRELWQAAVRRQVVLADQAEPDAERAVGDMLGQLSALQDRAAWFADERLRQRAIAETLLFGTGLADAVPSAAAQRAWRERGGTPR